MDQNYANKSALIILRRRLTINEDFDIFDPISSFFLFLTTQNICFMLLFMRLCLWNNNWQLREFFHK